MAKKKITTTEEEVEETPTENNPQTKEPPVETKAEEAVVETPKAPEIDIEEITRQVEEKVSQATAQKLIESLSGKKEESESYPWEKEGRNPTYKEALDYVGTKAEERVLAKLNDEVVAEETKEKADKEQLEAAQKLQTELLNKSWDQQLTELETTNRIPKIVDANNPNDPGVVIRKQMFKELNKNVAEQQAAGKIPSYSLKEVFYEGNFKRQPAGADAPIAGVRRSNTSDNSDGFKYSDIRGKKPADIFYGK